MNTRRSFLPETVAALLFAGVVVTSLTGGNDNGILGPVDSITLSGGDGDLTIKNIQNRISWGEENTSRVWAMGFMEIGKALSQLMKADHFIEVREKLGEELSERMIQVRAALDSLLEEGSDIGPNDPEADDIRNRGQRAYAEFQQMQQLIAEARNNLLAEQMQTAYAEVIEAVNVVAERLHIDMVLRFIPPDSEFQSSSPDATILQIRLRTALRLPEGIDITDEVRFD